MWRELATGVQEAFARAESASHWAAERGEAYISALRRFLGRLLWVCAWSIALGVIGALFGFNWLLALVGLAVAVMFALLALFAFPLGLISAIAIRKVQDLQTYLRVVAFVLLGILMLALYFSIVPVGANPAAIPIVLVVSAIFALLGAVFGISPQVRRRVFILIMAVFILSTLSFWLPRTSEAIGETSGKLDQFLASCLENPSSCLPHSSNSPRSHVVGNPGIIAQTGSERGSTVIPSEEPALPSGSRTSAERTSPPARVPSNQKHVTESDVGASGNSGSTALTSLGALMPRADRDQSAWNPRAIWLSLLRGKRVKVVFTQRGVELAAPVLSRLKRLGSVSELAPTGSFSSQSLESMSIYYDFDRLESAMALQASVADLGLVRLNQSRGEPGLVLVLR